MADFSFGFTQGSFLLLNGQKTLSSGLEGLVSSGNFLDFNSMMISQDSNGQCDLGRVENNDPQSMDYPLDPFHGPPYGPVPWTTSWTTFHGPPQFFKINFLKFNFG